MNTPRKFLVKLFVFSGINFDAQLMFLSSSGYVGGKAADSDKGAGVVALTMFDLRRRNKVNRVGMCGVNVSFWIFLYTIRMQLCSQERCFNRIS